MTRYLRHALTLLSIFLFACFPSEPQSNREVRKALSKYLGEIADPRVGFLKDSTHLKVDVATVAFPTRSEAEVTDHARDIARFAYEKYSKRAELDSVSVFYLEKIQPGQWWVRNRRAFAVETLAGNSTPTASPEPPNTR